MSGPRSFDDSVKDGTNVRNVERRTAQLKSKRGSAFFGDIGTTFSGPAREDIQKQDNSSHGDPDEREYEEFSNLPAWAALHPTEYGLQDPGKRTRFWEYQRKKESGELQPKEPQPPKEEPVLSRAADDRLWNTDEYRKIIPKKL